MTMLERCAAIIAPEAFKSLSEHEAEWKAWAERQDFGDGGQKIDPLKSAMACAQSDYDALAPRRAKALAKVRAVLEALMELDQPMIAAGAKLSAVKHEEILQRLNAMTIFRAMLTQALKDHP